MSLSGVAEKVQSELKARKISGYSDAMLAYREHLSGKEASPGAQIAFRIYESSRQREILEALLLSGCPDNVLEEALRVPKEAAQIYRELFFDLTKFQTDLDRLEYLEDYPDEWGRDLKLKAVSLGYEFVLFTFANLVPKTAAQKQLVERLFMATAYKAMAMNMHGIASNVTRLAVKHAELMLKAYDTLVKANANESPEDYNLVALLACEAPAGEPKPDSGEIV